MMCSNDVQYSRNGLGYWNASFGCVLDVIAVKEVARKWRSGTGNAQLSHREKNKTQQAAMQRRTLGTYTRKQKRSHTSLGLTSLFLNGRRSLSRATVRGIGGQAKAPFAALTSKQAHLDIRLPTSSYELGLFQIHCRVGIAE